MFPNGGVAIHYHGDLYNQTISEFLFFDEDLLPLSDVRDALRVVGDDKRLPLWHSLAVFQLRASRGLNSSDESSHTPWMCQTEEENHWDSRWQEGTTWARVRDGDGRGCVWKKEREECVWEHSGKSKRCDILTSWYPFIMYPGFSLGWHSWWDLVLLQC